MSRFFETIRITEGRPQFLSWHEARINKTRDHFWKGTSSFSLQGLLKPPHAFSQGTVRCRVVYGREIETIDYSLYSRKKIQTLMMMECNDIDYGYKFLDRTKLDELADRKENCDDIIIVKNGFITDSSIANLIFYDGKEWITPENPLLPGICRARLIYEGIIKPKSIKPLDLVGFSGARLINAMRYPLESEIIPIGQIQKTATFAKKK